MIATHKPSEADVNRNRALRSLYDAMYFLDKLEGREWRWAFGLVLSIIRRLDKEVE